MPPNLMLAFNSLLTMPAIIGLLTDLLTLGLALAVSVWSMIFLGGGIYRWLCQLPPRRMPYRLETLLFVSVTNIAIGIGQAESWERALLMVLMTAYILWARRDRLPTPGIELGIWVPTTFTLLAFVMPPGWAHSLLSLFAMPAAMAFRFGRAVLLDHLALLRQRQAFSQE